MKRKTVRSEALRSVVGLRPQMSAVQVPKREQRRQKALRIMFYGTFSDAKGQEGGEEAATEVMVRGKVCELERPGDARSRRVEAQQICGVPGLCLPAASESNNRFANLPWALLASSCPSSGNLLPGIVYVSGSVRLSRLNERYKQ